MQSVSVLKARFARHLQATGGIKVKIRHNNDYFKTNRPLLPVEGGQ